MKQLPFLKPFVMLLAGLISAVILITPAAPLSAQAEAERWSDPLNLSQSGAAEDPQLVVDSLGRGHALWREPAINRYVYARESNGSWTRPFPVELPFATNAYLENENADEQPIILYDATLLADSGGRIHAFWIDEDGLLFYSQVSADAFESFGAWTPPQLLSDSAVALATDIDNSGRIHVAYVRTLDAPGAPAGIYHQRAFASQGDWTGARNLYDSSYFRAISAENANIDIAITVNGVVWVGWDSPALEQVMVAGSADGGQGWSEPVLIDKREAEDSSGSVGPSELQLQAAGTDLHVFWEAGHGATTCAPYQQTTRDGGTTWLPRQIVPIVSGCQDTLQLLGTGNSATFLAATGAGSLMLSAWDGERWSEPQLQAGLTTSFVDAQTQRTVSLGCRQLALSGSDRLLLAGCDQGANGDIWSMDRALGSVDAWFADPSSWESASAVADSVDQPQGNAAVVDSAERSHLFWQSANGSVNYAQQTGSGWSSPVSLRVAASQQLPAFAATAGANGNLLLAWVDATSGNLLFSQVEGTRAGTPADWSEPVTVPQPSAAVTTPAIASLPNGHIAIAYALPLNEGRGLYLTQSADGGRTWSDPVLVFDAAAADWPVVDSPQLAATGFDSLHLLWQVRNEPAPAPIDTLFYARSTDSGSSWSAPAELRSGVETADGRFLWADVVGLGEQMVHRMWQRLENERLTLWHQVSLDNGLTWSQASAVADGTHASIGPADLVSSDTGHVLLLYAAPGSVRQLAWTEAGWSAADPLLVDDRQGVDGISAEAGSQQLQLAYVSEASDGSQSLWAAQSSLAAPAAAVDALPTPTPTPNPTITPSPTPEVMPTPVVEFPRERDGGIGQMLALPGLGSSVGMILVGAIAALLIVMVGLLIGMRTVRGKR